METIKVVNLKLIWLGDIRRVRLPLGLGVHYKSLCASIFGDSLPEDYVLKYYDDEQDYVTIASGLDWIEALHLRVKQIREKEEKSCSWHKPRYNKDDRYLHLYVHKVEKKALTEQQADKHRLTRASSLERELSELWLSEDQNAAAPEEAHTGPDIHDSYEQDVHEESLEEEEDAEENENFSDLPDEESLRRQVHQYLRQSAEEEGESETSDPEEEEEAFEGKEEESMYSEKTLLDKLDDMGFTNRDVNRYLLAESHGDLSLLVHSLLSLYPQN